MARPKIVFSAFAIVGIFSLSLLQVDVFSQIYALVKNIYWLQDTSVELARQSDVTVNGNSVENSVKNSVKNNKVHSVAIRLVTLPHFLNIAWDNLFYGVGFGQSNDLIGHATGHFVGPHNIFLGVLVEYGLAAFCAFLVLIIWPFAKGFLYNETQLRKGEVTLSPTCIYSCFISVLIHGMFHTIYVNFSLWLFVALLMALCSGKAKRKKVFR